MSTCVVMGSQWGDEGKGKIVDLLARGAHVVVRFQGGANAGHTIWHGDKKYVFHQLPSGLLTPGCLNLMGNGCVVDPVLLVKEMGEIGSFDHSRLGISSNAHVIMPIHKMIDAIQAGHIGTTKRGIGYAYADKARRRGIRLGNIFDHTARTLWEKILDAYKWELVDANPDYLVEAQEEIEGFLNACFEIRPYIRDIRPELVDALQENKNVLYEGAQGALLDIDHGSYPFVTSSNTTIGGALTGTGVYTQFDHRIAVVKAYSTRVGTGPFPTEQKNETGEDLRKRGNEYGATTGRPRRCGWLDLHLLKEATIASGYSGIALTKLDCLTGIPVVRVAVGRDSSDEPVYEFFHGWDEDIQGKDFEDLPKNARDYVAFISEHLQVPITILSTGPDRDQTQVLNSPW